MRAIFKGTGMYVPPDVVDNHHMAKVMDTSDAWIRQRTGIVTRRFAREDQATSDMAVPAAEQALKDAGVDKSEIDYVVFATMSPDYYFPGSGPVFAKKLGIQGVPCLDIRQQCAGFLYGIQVVDALIRSGQYKNVLLIGAEEHGCFMPWSCWDVVFGESDREISAEDYAWNTRFRDRVVLFGDGGGAFVVSASEDDGHGVEDVLLYSDGDHLEKMWVKGGGSAYRPFFSTEMAETGEITPIVAGREVFKTAVTRMPEAVLTILERNGYGLEDVDLVIAHQANLRINEAIQKKLKLPDEKIFNNIQRYGNTTAGTLPIAFHEARTERSLKSGDLICFVALGSGLNWGAALYRY